MRVVKIILWIIIAYVIQSVFGNVISVFGVVPELLLIFSIIYSFRERRLSDASYVIVICSIAAAVCSGKSFATVLLVVGFASTAAYRFSDVLRFVPKYIRCFALVLISSAAIGFTECFYSNGTVSLNHIYTGILPYVIYTCLCSGLLYPIIGITLFPKEKGKKLLII